MTTTLYYSNPNDTNLKQILVSAKYLRLEINTQQYNKKYDPLTLLTPEGTLNQPNSILFFLAQNKLTGQNETDQSQVYQWFEHFNLEIYPLLREIYEQIGNQKPLNKEKYEYCVKELLRELEVVNSHLKIRTFMVGDSVTLVDISLATHLSLALEKVINEDTRKKFPNLIRWFTFLRSSEPFLQVLKECLLCGKVAFTVEEKQKEEVKA